MSPDQLAKILGELRMDRNTYKRYRCEGEHWRRICGEAFEWLAFIVPFQKLDFKASFTQFRDLKDDEIKALHALLVDDYAAALKKAADALHISLLPGADPVEFAWEYNAGVRAQDPREPTLPELLRRLVPLPLVKANIWNADRFVNTPAPPGWPETSPWPSDPTALEAACQQCDFCDGHECPCAQRVNGPTPFRIVDYDNGRGIEAIAHDEAISQAQKPPAHLKGELLGLLAGEIYPLGSTEEPAHWSFDFHRPDFEGDGAVCQIRLAAVASCFRLLSVATQPTARLTRKRLGGRWVIAVEAERDIKDGEQITVSSLPWKRNA